MSADAVTAKMANTTISAADGATVGAGGDPINFEQNEKAKASALEGRRLYIGNLAYATTEGELKDFFKDYLVESTSIPTNPRTTRPVGYAFLDVSTSSEAERAINEMNGKTILDRKVSVQLARNPADAPEGGEGVRRRNSARGRGRSGRGRGGRQARSTRAEGENGPTNVPGQVLPLTDTTNEALSGTNGQGTSAAHKKTRGARKRGPTEDGVPSKTKVMVANLPYDLEENKLMELFAEYKPSAAKIALRPIPKYMIRKLEARHEARKGRGFGFVTLGSEELQQKACAEMNGKEIEGREIAVKVAIDSPGKEDQDPNAPEQPGAEPASTAEGSASVAPTTAA